MATTASPTFEQAIERFIARGIDRGLERATVKSYKYFARRFLVPCLGEIRVTDLSFQLFEAMYTAMTNAGLDPRTIRKAHTFAGAVLKLAQREGHVATNVVKLAELPKPTDIVRDVPTPAEFETFQAVALKHDSDIHQWAHTIAATGMRPGEAAAIRQGDLSESLLLTIERAVDCSERPAALKCTKTGRTRRITIDPHTASVIRARGGDFVFGGDTFALQDCMGKRFKRIARKAGTSFTQRSLRHWHATQLLASGKVNPKQLAERLGHTDPSISLKVYAQYVPDLDAAASDAIADVLGAAA